LNGDADLLALPRTATGQLPSAPRPVQRAGHIGSDDNRFCGASVFADLAARAADPTALLCLAFGVPLPDADGREVLRLAALCVTSPDARVWPLKMTRVLSSYGNPFAGFFAAQLANYSDRMGPGTAAHAAVSLRWLDARLERSARDDDGDYPPAAVAAAVAEHLASRGRIAGFGVPFRKDDERRVALFRLLSGHSAQRGRAWRLHLQVVEAMRAKETLQPNIVLSLAALFLDLGLAAERAGLFLTMMMSHNFAAHALEAAERDRDLLRELPSSALEDHSAPPRHSPRARTAIADGPAPSALL
jgi:Citrate synthase, C-terminal domain